MLAAAVIEGTDAGDDLRARTRARAEIVILGIPVARLRMRGAGKARCTGRSLCPPFSPRQARANEVRYTGVLRRAGTHGGVLLLIIHMDVLYNRHHPQLGRKVRWPPEGCDLPGFSLP